MVHAVVLPTRDLTQAPNNVIPEFLTRKSPKNSLKISLNVNGLNALAKDTNWQNGYKIKTCINAVYKRPTSYLQTHVE